MIKSETEGSQGKPVWLIFDEQKPKLLPGSERHVGLSHPDALKVTSSDGLTTLINGKWIKSAKILSHFELATIHQLLAHPPTDLLQLRRVRS